MLLFINISRLFQSSIASPFIAQVPATFPENNSAVPPAGDTFVSAETNEDTT